MAGVKPQKIKEVVTYNGWGGYFFEDIDKIRSKFIPPEDRYHTKTDHDRYPYIRTPAPVVGVGIKLEDGSVHFGDAVAVSFGGKAGRAGPGNTEQLEHWFKSDFAKWAKGREITRWLEIEQNFLGQFKSIPAFIRYAVSQALLSAASRVSNELPYKLIASDLGLTPSTKPIPLHGSSGANFSDTVDRMLARKIPYLPQGQFEDIANQIGPNGLHLLDWIKNFKKRAARFNYSPTLTLDFHGSLDQVFSGDDKAIAEFIAAMAKKSVPHPLHLESPIVGKTLQDHGERLTKIKSLVSKNSPGTKIIADEWANELADINYLISKNAVDGIHIKMPDTGALSECAEAVAACKKSKVFALLGGSCTETDIGARASAHLALACSPDALLVKPGMGFDESFVMINNELSRQLMS